MNSGANGKNADVQAAKLVVKSSIRERVAELKAEAGAKAEFTRAAMLAFLAAVIRTESAQMRDRLRAVELLAKMCGWFAPKGVKVGPDDELMELLKKLRGRGRPHAEGA